MGAFGAPLPSLVGRAIRRPVILAHGGSDAFVFLPLNARGRLWVRAPRLLVAHARHGPDG